MKDRENQSTNLTGGSPSATFHKEFMFEIQPFLIKSSCRMTAAFVGRGTFQDKSRVHGTVVIRASVVHKDDVVVLIARYSALSDICAQQHAKFGIAFGPNGICEPLLDVQYLVIQQSGLARRNVRLEARDVSTKHVMEENLVVCRCAPDTELMLEHAHAPIERIFDRHVL
jgi:hypothetical protein